MTADQVIEELKALGERFYREGRVIRSRTHWRPYNTYNSFSVELCPVCVLCFRKTGVKFLNSEYLDAAKAIGLNTNAAACIAAAADGNEPVYGSPEVQKLREKMLADLVDAD